jgi:hypothetical protein
MGSERGEYLAVTNRSNATASRPASALRLHLPVKNLVPPNSVALPPDTATLLVRAAAADCRACDSVANARVKTPLPVLASLRLIIILSRFGELFALLCVRAHGSGQ